MDTVIFHDLSKIINRRHNPVKAINSFQIYIHRPKVGGFGTHIIAFNPDFDIFKDGFLFMNLAENKLTGEKFINFSKTQGAELRPLNKNNKGKGSIGTAKNLIVRYIADFLKLKYENGLNSIVIFSENLSPSEHSKTYKILETKCTD